MDKNNIMTVLNDWNFWNKEIPTGVLRDGYLKKNRSLLTTNQIIVITGPRRAGKSFIMRQFAKDLISNGTNKKNTLIVNFEDPRYENLNTDLLHTIYETYLEFLAPDEKPYIFLDEIQDVPGWERWVTMMHELNKANLIVSGSNAKLLSKELATLLTGRHVTLKISTLSLSEYFLFKNIDIGNELSLIDKRTDIARAFREYLEFGSFPAVVLAEEKTQILLNYYDDVINKDLIKRFKIRKPEQLKKLAHFYFSNTSSPVTFSSTEKFISANADTIEKFSSYFEDVYFFYFVKRFSPKVKEQNKSPRKVYPIDSGLANVVGFRISPNWGSLAESLVFLELSRMMAEEPELETYYWKDLQHREINFVIKKGFNISSLVQVCWDVSSPKTKQRECSALIKGMEAFGQKDGFIITESFESEERHDDKTIRYIPLWKWLLKPNGIKFE